MLLLLNESLLLFLDKTALLSPGVCDGECGAGAGFIGAAIGV